MILRDVEYALMLANVRVKKITYLGVRPRKVVTKKANRTLSILHTV